MTAVSHPLRRRILRSCLDAGFDGTSASALARGMGESVGRVAYHLKVLARCEILSLEPGQGERGAGEIRYGWADGVEARWLGLVLELWPQSDSAG
jgi:DNA-binding transcriptional ArsR family regulator